MRITYAGLSSPGPVRQNNEDSLTFWQPIIDEDWRNRGALIVLADGVGGHGKGEVASALACQKSVEAFTAASPGVQPAQVLDQMFTAANLAVYDAGMMMQQEEGGRMMTTLTISLFRNNQISIGHVGYCRAFVIQQGRIRRITNDHSYTGVQVKLGLITVQDAASSQLRSVLTRTVGQDPFVRLDYHTVTVTQGDYLIQCTDGLWCFVTDGEIYDLVTKRPPEQACKELIELAERRGGDDNLSIQIVRVESVERLSYYRGLPTYSKIESATMGHELEPGQVLDDRYEITDLVAKSGMASIFRATDRKTGRVVALKVPFMHLESDPGFFSRFQREAEIGKRLDHPYILKFLSDDDESRSRPYIVMEYLEGQTLGHLMRSVRPMPTTDAIRIASRVCEALHYMHEHDVVHRDLKPENIMICNDGSIRIMDFGIAKYEGMRRLTFGGFTPAMGTPDYMAPEQVKGRRGDQRTDIYSLGAILYEMVTGTVPFEGANPFLIMNARLSGDPIAPRVRNPELSPQVEEIILHAMARNPHERYHSAMEMKNDLDAPEKVQLTGRAERLQTPKIWRSRWRQIRVYAIGIGIPALAVGIYFALRLVHYLAGHLHWQ